MAVVAPSFTAQLEMPLPRQSTGQLMRQPPAVGESIERSDNAVQPASLTFKDLAFSAKLPGGEKQTILEPCSGHFEPGQLAAIMGPSGCGKSTLLDMLAMKKTAQYSGEVAVNGRPRDPTLFPRIAAYVGQEDQMPAHWKVREALEFNTALKRPANSTSSRKATADFINNLLEAFGLAGVANTYIGGTEVRGISGGQRRRVTLARGVAAQASILFCDEPTSGLSATDAELCIKALRVVAKRMNVLALVVIHQPRREVAALFDTLVLLTSNPGRMAYFGPMGQCPSYMESCGYPVPALASATDFYLDLLTPGAELDASDALVAAFASRQRPGLVQVVDEALKAEGQTAKEMLIAAQQQTVQGNQGASVQKARLGPYAVSFGGQVKTLLRRKVLLTLRNPGAIGMQIAMPTVMGVVLGTVFQGIGKHAFGIAQLQFIFILLTMLSLQSLPLMPLLIEERVFMKLETSEKLYKEGAYILTTLFVTVPLSILGATIQTLIIYGFAQLPFDYLPTILGWTLLLFFLFDALFQCVAAAAPDGEQAISMATPFLVIFMLFNGLVVTRATAPVFLRWIFEISPTSYALQSIVLMMAEDADETGKFLVAGMGYRPGENMKGIVVIACMTAVLRVLQVLALKYLNKVQR